MIGSKIEFTIQVNGTNGPIDPRGNSQKTTQSQTGSVSNNTKSMSFVFIYFLNVKSSRCEAYGASSTPAAELALTSSPGSNLAPERPIPKVIKESKFFWVWSFLFCFTISFRVFLFWCFRWVKVINDCFCFADPFVEIEPDLTF